jgi:hypothetical protein
MRTKKISQRQERKMAADLGGTVEAGSGAEKFAGGDVRVVGELRGEAKYTEKDYYTLKLSDLQKIKRQAAKRLEEAVFQIAFRNPLTCKSSIYAIVPCAISDADKEYTWVVLTCNKSTRLRDDSLNHILGDGRFFLKFEDGSEYEVLHWDDYLERRRLDAGD